MFCDTPAGAEASARLYCLVETAKANGLEPYAYLRRVFTGLPRATTLEDISKPCCRGTSRQQRLKASPPDPRLSSLM